MTTPLTWHNCYDDSLKGLVTPESFKHPAKMARGLCERILDHGCERGYWQPGATTLCDPFGGVGTTGLVGAYRGYQVISIELEPHFVGMHTANIERNRRKLEQLGRPLPRVVQGDSRKLSELISGMAGTITSPPFLDSLMTSDETFMAKVEKDKRNGSRLQPAPSSYGSSAGQFGTMPAGDHAAIVGAVTSPPFAVNNQGVDMTTPGRAKIESRFPGIAKRHAGSVSNHNAYGAGVGQINNMPPGDVARVVGAITSPPGGDDPAPDKMTGGTYHGVGLAGAVTSPPYADSLEKSNGIDATKIQSRFGPNSQALQDTRSGASDGQLGAMDVDTYWGACAEVYRQVFALLPTGGCLAVVVKNHIKNGKRVPLCDQTADLLAAIGFDVAERARAMLVKESRTPTLFGDEHIKRTERKSFFRRLAERKGSPRIDWEEVIFAVRA